MTLKQLCPYDKYQGRKNSNDTIPCELCCLWFVLGLDHAGLLEFYYIEMVLKVHAKVNFIIRQVKYLSKSSKQIDIKMSSEGTLNHSMFSLYLSKSTGLF